MRALATVAIRYGVSAGSMIELVRRAYVDAAERSLIEDNKKPLTTRLCALTGFYRKEIVRIKALPPVGDSTADDRYNRSARIVSGWLRDAEFCTKNGQPAVLKLEGDVSFDTLVKRYSGDMTPNAMLEELVRLEVVEMTARKAIKLKTRAYIPQANELDILQIMGSDTADLIATIDHNIRCSEQERRFQRKVSYVHIPERQVYKFKVYAAKESQLLLEKLDRWLAQRDTEERSLGTPGSRLGLGIYMVEEENQHATLTGDAYEVLKTDNNDV